MLHSHSVIIIIKYFGRAFGERIKNTEKRQNGHKRQRITCMKTEAGKNSYDESNEEDSKLESL